MDVHDVTVMGNIPENADTINRHFEGTRHVREHSIHPPDTHTPTLRITAHGFPWKQTSCPAPDPTAPKSSTVASRARVTRPRVSVRNMTLSLVATGIGFWVALKMEPARRPHLAHCPGCSKAMSDSRGQHTYHAPFPAGPPAISEKKT